MKREFAVEWFWIWILTRNFISHGPLPPQSQVHGSWQLGDWPGRWVQVWVHAAVNGGQGSTHRSHSVQCGVGYPAGGGGGKLPHTGRWWGWVWASALPGARWARGDEQQTMALQALHKSIQVYVLCGKDGEQSKATPCEALALSKHHPPDSLPSCIFIFPGNHGFLCSERNLSILMFRKFLIPMSSVWIVSPQNEGNFLIFAGSTKFFSSQVGLFSMYQPHKMNPTPGFHPSFLVFRQRVVHIRMHKNRNHIRPQMNAITSVYAFLSSV